MIQPAVRTGLGLPAAQALGTMRRGLLEGPGWMKMLLGQAVRASLLLCALAGCERRVAPPVPAMAAQAAAPPPAAAPEAQARQPWFTPAPQQGADMHMAYTHAVTLEVAGSALPAHFTAARDRCLTDAALHCLLLHAELGTGGGYDQRLEVSAALRVRLPHDQVAAYANALTAPLAGEAPGLVRVLRQSTTAEDLGRPVADVAQRVAQLSQYLASLKALGARLTISVSDLVKIASETAQAQTEIETAQAQQRTLALQVDTEELDVDFQPQPPRTAQVDPVTRVIDGAQDVLRQNAADALAFGIAAVPWIPVGLVALILLAILRRVVVGRRAR